MPVFERPPLETLAPAKDRWTPIYLEHGRLEVDDASVKWISSEGFVAPLPIATISALIMGPGTTLTHAAIKTCAQSNCPIVWMGEEGMRFYAHGITPNHTNSKARIHAAAWASTRQRSEIARRMFLNRFPDANVQGISIKQLRGMEGKRVRQTYSELGEKYGVSWKGRDYKVSNWNLADNINRALSAANGSFYALTAAVCCSMGFIPQLGFIHQSGTLPFIYDVADLYKKETSWAAAFEAISIDPGDQGDLVRKILKRNIEQGRILTQMPKDLNALFEELPGKTKSDSAVHPLQPKSPE